MTSSEQRTAATSAERRLRWIALASLVILVPATIAATGWRDLREINSTRELKPIDVPGSGTVDYSGARVGLVGLNAIPWEPGLPKDRTFVRARLAVEPGVGGAKWLGCKLQVIDAAGHTWAAMEPVPDLVRKTLAKPGDANGMACDAVAAPGGKVFVDGYYLVPRPIPRLRVTMSSLDGRPNYLRFVESDVQ